MSGDVLIAGAGMGGLTAALSLHGAGIPAQVFEAVPKLEPLGVGINLLPHAVRELDALGLLPQLSRAGCCSGSPSPARSSCGRAEDQVQAGRWA